MPAAVPSVYPATKPQHVILTSTSTPLNPRGAQTSAPTRVSQSFNAETLNVPWQSAALRDAQAT